MNPYKPKVLALNPEKVAKITEILKKHALTTICEEAACPNRSECYGRAVATFMILGNTCTRACRFCNVKTGKPSPPDPSEPERIAKAIKALNLSYVVITSVDRDDLKDFGARHFAKCVLAIKSISPQTKIELLTPDFKANTTALDIILSCDVDKLAHNQETIRQFTKHIRPQSDYERSLKVLKYYATYSNKPVKSSLMVGFGETKAQLLETMQDLYDAGVTQLTLGQYLQPTQRHHRVIKYYTQDFFDEMKEKAYLIGFKAVSSGILVRSSYFAEQL